VRTICERIERDAGRLHAEFARDRNPVKSRFAVLDDVLPPAHAEHIHASFPPLSQMRLMSSFRERKYTSKALDGMSSLIRDAIFAFQAPEVVAAVARITGIQGMVGDRSLYAGGVSAMTRGQFLNPHIDNSHEMARSKYRRVNVLYYVTPDWISEWGGNLELWDPTVRKPTEIPSLFNRLVIMETTRNSWHSVNPVRASATRCCISNYYFSPDSPDGTDYFHITSFKARPEQPVARLLASADRVVRSCLRQVIPRGIATHDVYQPDVTSKPS
jgi:Rps23 Pro-64 3,4-dihydroxylase Tpa1-like proline 4-hydroxylase